MWLWFTKTYTNLRLMWVLLIGLTSILAGNLLVMRMRATSGNSNKAWIPPSLVVIGIPFTVHILSQIGAHFVELDALVSNSCFVGLLVGIMSNLLQVPSGADTVKLSVAQVNIAGHMVKRETTVLVDSIDITVMEAKRKIAEALSVYPAGILYCTVLYYTVLHVYCMYTVCILCLYCMYTVLYLGLHRHVPCTSSCTPIRRVSSFYSSFYFSYFI